MTPLQKAIKYCAIGLAVCLIVSILGGITGAFAGLSLVFSEEEAVGQTEQYPITGQVRELEIDIAAARLEIRTGQAVGVESNLKKLSVKEFDGKLSIIEKSKKVNNTFKDAVLIITLPEALVLETVEISAGAGKMTAQALSAESLELELGAGDVEIQQLTSTRKTRIEGGAGKVTVYGGTLANLELELGVGDLDMTTALSGRSEIACGIGNAQLNLLGQREDYTIALEKGVGDAKIDGSPVKNNQSYGTGSNMVEIEAGIGNISIDFREAG